MSMLLLQFRYGESAPCVFGPGVALVRFTASLEPALVATLTVVPG